MVEGVDRGVEGVDRGGRGVDRGLEVAGSFQECHS